MKILFISTLNLATNPRLVKEIKLALEKGYRVELACFEFNNWSRGPDEEIKKQFPNIKIHTLAAGRRPLVPWLINVAAEKLNRSLLKIFPLGTRALSQAVSRRSNILIDALKNIDGADLVIGHNPGALFPAYVAAKKYKCPAGFDVEDYYPGEGNNIYLQKLTHRLMQKLLQRMDYVSFASPFIMKEVQNDTAGHLNNPFTILNYFPGEDFTGPVNLTEGRLRLAWFSQNIDAGRGLELVLPFIKQSPQETELHLIGNMNEAFYEKYLKGCENIYIHAPLPQKDLHQSLAQYDIGLALEPAKDRNNELAVSNKILAYLQAGLYVVATNTPAQQDLLKSAESLGICFDYQTNNFETVLTGVLKQKELIRRAMHLRFQNFKNRNWSMEAEKLSNTWNALVT